VQDKELKEGFVLLAVPMEAIAKAGITDGQVLEFTAKKGKITIQTVDDTSDFVCDGDCENCPINETDCDGDCENCPCYEDCEE
jgi:hypothetical protein